MVSDPIFILQGAVSAAAFYGVGEFSGAHSFSGSKEAFFMSPQHVAQTLGHAVVGCAQAAASGGSCASGASAAAFSALAGPQIPGEVGSADNFAGRVIVGALGGKIGGGTFEGGAFTAAFGYLFNDVGGRKNPAQGALAVVEVEKRLIAEGWTPLGGQTRAAIDGLPERRYDLTMKSPDGVEFGIEVKSTIRATFKLDSQQVAFDAMTMDKGALVLSGPLRGQMIRNVLYVGYGFEGARDAVFATKVLQLTLDRMGIQTRVAGSVGGVK